MIFVEKPYFNEPGYEKSQGTKLGDENSKQYTAEIRTYTIKYALIEHLISPNIEFGITIKEFIKKAWNTDSNTVVNNTDSKMDLDVVKTIKSNDDRKAEEDMETSFNVSRNNAVGSNTCHIKQLYLKWANEEVLPNKRREIIENIKRIETILREDNI